VLFTLLKIEHLVRAALLPVAAVLSSSGYSYPRLFRVRRGFALVDLRSQSSELATILAAAAPSPFQRPRVLTWANTAFQVERGRFRRGGNKQILDLPWTSACISYIMEDVIPHQSSNDSS